MAGKPGTKWQVRKFKALMEHALEQEDVQMAVCKRIKDMADTGKDQDFISLLSVYARLTTGEVNVNIRSLIQIDE